MKQCDVSSALVSVSSIKTAHLGSQLWLFQILTLLPHIGSQSIHIPIFVWILYSMVIYLHSLVPMVFGWLDKMYGLAKYLITHNMKVVPTQNVRIAKHPEY